MAGAKSINSINIYPAIQRWEQIDVEKRYHKVYNRYAHISIQLGSETSFKEISADHFTVSLSYEDAKKLGIKYIFTYYALSGQTGWDTHLMQVYEDGNLRIYNVL
jgi:hypothetical protein